MKKLFLSLFLMSTFFMLSAQKSCKVLKKETKEFREAYKEDFRKEERSPFYKHPENLDYLRFYKPKRKFQTPATFQRTADAEPFDMATYSGKIQPYIKHGTLTFNIKGKSKQLAVYQSLRLRDMEEYKDHLFIPFKDLTNDEQTYGGGRYIDLKMSDIQNNKVLLDFNRCYNPWCAFSDGYNCPVPPFENHLDIPIKAGEKMYGKKVVH